MRRRFHPYDICNNLFMFLLCVAFLYPFVYTLGLSLSSSQEILKGHVWLLPRGLTFSAYSLLFKDKYLLYSFYHTTVLTLGGLLWSLAMTTLLAYPLSRPRLRGKSVVTVYLVITMYFSGGLIPFFILIRNLGLMDRLAALVVPGISIYFVIIMRTFFAGIPEELHESAQMEGADQCTVLLRIVLPLSVPVVATLTVFYSVGLWNTFYRSLMFISSPQKYTLQHRLYLILDFLADTMSSNPAYQNMSADIALRNVAPENLKAATILVTTLPIVIVYPFVQKYFTKGAIVGALKG